MRAKRVMVFIDGSNIYHALLDNLGTTKIHYGRLAEVLASDGELVMAYYYDTSNRPNDYTMTAKKHQRFLEWIRHLPKMTLRLGRLKMKSRKCHECKQVVQVPVEKKVDVMIATDMLKAAYDDQADILILVSGDNDFTYTVEEIKRRFEGIKVDVACFRSSLSNELRSVADKVRFLDNLNLLESCPRKSLSELVPSRKS